VCGIAGILVADGQVPRPALEAMTAALADRGPDGVGFHVEGSIGLGHRRLAVIDVTGGHQPLYSEDRQVVVVVNGELYNFVALRAELEKLGHRFATKSDCEVLAHGYEAWGDAVVDRIEGMFAFAIWDARRERLVLGRDRMGEKPLFWARLPGGGIAFASELKALKRAPGIAGDIDPASLARYLVYEYVPAPFSMIRGVRKLPPGGLLVASRGQIEERQALTIPLLGDDEPREHDVDRAASNLLMELRRSVRERLVSDVPLGVFLSGGIDSSSVAALAAEELGGKIDTFSMGFEDPTFDEAPMARLVAEHIGSRHHEERVSPRAALDLMPDIGRLLDEPLGDASIVPTHLLARFARRHVTVALGGDGGDELFSGYPTFQAERAAALLDHAPAALRGVAVRAGTRFASALPTRHGYFSFDFRARRFLRGAVQPLARRHQAWIGALLPADALAIVDAPLDEDELWRDAESRAVAPSQNRWDRLLHFYARGFLGDQVLTKVDRATMAVGLEGRAPLLDSKIIALACSLDPALRMRGLTTKYVLKRAMRHHLPQTILARKKQGFAMPVGSWLTRELRPLLEEDLGVARLEAAGFRPAPVRRLVDEHLAGRADHRKPLWSLIAYQRWHEVWTKI
jgi:asparagine synthase (glutamine-hydrolysing)